MDIDQMVKDLMKAERLPLDRFYQRRTTLEWQRDAYREMNTMLASFRDISTNLTRSTSLGAKTVTTSNNNIATATATSGAALGSYTLSNVELATAARNLSDTPISDGTLNPTQSLWSQRDKLDPSFTSTTDTHTQAEIKVGADGTSFRLAKGAIAGDLPIDVITVRDSEGDEKVFTVKYEPLAEGDTNSVYINRDTGQMTFGTALEKGDTIEGFTYEHHVITFSLKTYNSKGEEIAPDPIKLDATSTLNQVLTAINNSSAGVTAFYHEFSDKVMFTRKETGDLGNGLPGMVFSESGDFLTNVLKLNSANEERGSNAKFNINGLYTEQKGNTFTMNGMTISLKSNTTGTETINLTVNANNDKALEEVMSFVNSYNNLIETINGKINERKNRGFPPLTDEQKRELSDREVELWEEKARSGLLQGDSTLRSALDQLRRSVYNTVSGVDTAYNQLAKIGITTSRDFRENGKLVVDEAKLRQALSDNPNAVMQLFNKAGEGIAHKTREIATNTIRSIETRAGNQFRTNQQFSLGRELMDVERRISDFERRLVGIENRYWNQFTAMEKALGQMNSQANYLYSQFMS